MTLPCHRRASNSCPHVHTAQHLLAAAAARCTHLWIRRTGTASVAAAADSASAFGTAVCVYLDTPEDMHACLSCHGVVLGPSGCRLHAGTVIEYGSRQQRQERMQLDAGYRHTLVAKPFGGHGDILYPQMPPVIDLVIDPFRHRNAAPEPCQEFARPRRTTAQLRTLPTQYTCNRCVQQVYNFAKRTAAGAGGSLAG